MKVTWLFCRDRDAASLVAQVRGNKHSGPTSAAANRIRAAFDYDRSYNLEHFAKSPQGLRELADLIERKTI